MMISMILNLTSSSKLKRESIDSSRRKRKFKISPKVSNFNRPPLIRKFELSIFERCNFASIDRYDTRIDRCSDTCEPSVEHLALEHPRLEGGKKQRRSKKEDTRAAVRRSISGALIGGGKAGKRYITVWHDGAPWSAIYWERTRLKPMINEPG